LLNRKGSSVEGRTDSSLCNWLKELDAAIRKFPRAAHWLHYPNFWFARYPRLRPKPVAGISYSKPICEAAAKVFSAGVSEWTRRISQHEEAKRALEGLNPKQRHQLAALALDCVDNLEGWKKCRPIARRVRQISSEAPRRNRMLLRRVAKARRSLEELADYAKCLHPLLGKEYERIAEICLTTLAVLPQDESTDFYRSLPSFYPTPEDPTTLCMVQLYWLFRHGGGLTGDESEVRVALIRNAFWTKYGVEKVPYREAYDGAQSKGCEAVHRAVYRFSLASSEVQPS
jgi:hypothetical protein